MLARTLVDAGHEVTWWASSFDHYQKRHVLDTEDAVSPYPGLKIRALRGCGYARNFSLKRFLDYGIVGVKFVRQSGRVDAPDVILCGFPSIELSVASVWYGLKRGVPVILDVKDMWPDIFLDYAPAGLRMLSRLVLWPMLQMSRWACAHATAITGMTDAFVDWGVARGTRTRTQSDRSFPFGYATKGPTDQAIKEAEAFWDSLSVTAAAASRTVCYLGGIGHQLDLSTVIHAARKLAEMEKPIKIVLCGTGDRLDYYREQAKGLDNVLFAGWVGAAEIYVLMRRSYAGLDPLPDRFDFLASINNKAIEYFSAGLPVISSPPCGVLSELISEKHAGLSYKCGDHGRLAQILLELCEQSEKRKTMAGNARRLFEEQFMAEKVYAAMAVYVEMIANNKSPG
jgi:glycosyltransferase involved in cell wall biosynthesis